MKVFWLALLGRFIFGLGFENLGGKFYLVTKSAILSHWFVRKEIALAFGLALSVSRLGNVASYLIEPELYNQTGSVDLGLWLGLVFCGFSFAVGIISNIFDKYRDNKLGKIE